MSLGSLKRDTLRLDDDDDGGSRAEALDGRVVDALAAEAAAWWTWEREDGALVGSALRVV